MAVFWEDLAKIIGIDLNDKMLVGRNSDGETVYADVQQLYDVLSKTQFADVKPSVISAGANLGSPSSLTVHYAPAGNYTTASGNITLTENLNLLFWDFTGWTGISFNVLANYFKKSYNTFATQGFWTSSGTFNNSNSWKSTGQIPVVEGEKIIFSLKSTSGAALVTFFNSANAIISSVNASSPLADKGGSAIAPANTAYIVASTYGDSTTSNIVIERSLELELAKKAEHGYTGTPKTLKDVEDASNVLSVIYNTFPTQGFWTSSGTFNNNSSWKSTVQIPVLEGDKVNYTLKSTSGAALVTFFNSANAIISSVNASSPLADKVGSAIAPANTAYIVASAFGDSTNSSVVIEKNKNIVTNDMISELAKKANHGYTGTPKTLKEVEDNAKKVGVLTNTFPTQGFWTNLGVFNNSNSWKSTAKISVAVGETVSYSLKSTNGAALITFFNSSNAVISSINASSPLADKTGSTVAPANSAYFVASTYLDSTTSYVSVDRDTASVVKDLQTQIDTKVTATTSKTIQVRKDQSENASLYIFNSIATALTYFIKGDIIQVFEGLYVEYGLQVPDFCVIVGVGTVIVRGELPASATTAQIDEISTFDIRNNVDMSNIIATAKNMRYPIHSDFGGDGIVQKYKNCEFVHLGNNEAYAYRVANSSASPNSPSEVFRAQSAFGCGTSSGSLIQLEQCVLRSVMRGLSTHDNVNFHTKKGASTLIAKDCIIESQAIDLDGTLLTFKPSVFVQSLASYTQNNVVLENCVVDGNLVLQASSQDWREFTHTVFAKNTPLQVVRNTCGGGKTMTDETNYKQAYNLVISAVNTSYSEVKISGSIGALFWKVESFIGASGKNSYLKVLENVNILLSKINASTNKDLTIQDNTVTKNITLSSSYASVSALLADLNTKAPEFLFTQEFNLGFVVEDERNFYLRNAGTTVIKKNTAVQTSGLNVSNFVGGNFFGVALEDIAPGKSGKIRSLKGSSVLRIYCLLNSTLTEGTSVYANNSTSLFTTSATGATLVGVVGTNQNIVFN